MQEDVNEKINSFFTQYPSRTHKKGQIILYPGDIASHIFHLVDGRVKQYDISYRGDEVVLNIFKPPAFFPMSQAINKTANNYFFECDSEVQLHRAPADAVLEFVRSNPNVAYDLLSRVYRGTDGLLGRMAHLMASTAKSRVMYELIIECRRFGDTGGTDLAITASESDLGARAGLTRETVSRELQKLKAEGLITVSQKRLTVPDLIALETRLGRDL